METRKGTIIKILRKAGYGFLRQEEGTDIFFHALGCVDPDFEDMREGMEVSYLYVEMQDNEKSRAIGVVAN